MDLIERLQWRHAVKAMNGKRVPEEKIDRILEAARLAPSGNGLQPIEIFVITNQEIKDKIKKAAINQIQVSTCSHLLVFAAWNRFTAENINETFDFMKNVDGRDTPEDYKQHVIKSYTERNAKEQSAMADNQAFIALGIAVAAAAFETLDSCPMTGFSPDEVDKILNLKEKDLHSVALLPIGYRDSEQDWNEKLPKARKPKEKFITKIN
ncbi:MAG: nitroreductase family protein [Flavobacteriaceae bacterium]|jgi:nitroreductase|nr:nitroreductase family protein [Flavobacteriaceae bacterium]